MPSESRARRRGLTKPLPLRNRRSLDFGHACRGADGCGGPVCAPEGGDPRGRAARIGSVAGAGPALRARPGRAEGGRGGGAAARRQGRAGEALPPAPDALVRRARVRRPARVQRRRAQADRRPRRAHLQARAEMNIVVCRPQVPFVYGGAELMADQLVAELRARGHQAETVSIPFKWYPGSRVLDQAFLWRLVDLTESNGVPIDRVIATKFPAYCVRHPNKVVWVLHQFRQAYDIDRTGLVQFSESPEDRATRAAIERLDAVALGEARKVFATSRNVADRLQRFNGIDAEVLPHPPQALAYREAEPEGYVLSVNRLDRAKRIDLL